MVERQDLDNFTCFQARERCALEIAAYVFKCLNCDLCFIDSASIKSTSGPLAPCVIGESSEHLQQMSSDPVIENAR